MTIPLQLETLEPHRVKPVWVDCGAIEGLAKIVRPNASWGEVRLAMLTVAFDASGTEHDQRLFVVAGFVSSANDWIGFDAQWKERLKRDGLEYFHMHSFAHSIGQFKGWNKDELRRQALLSDLLGIIQSHAYRKFGSMVINRFFGSKISAKNIEAFKLTAYSLTGLTVTYKVRKWMRNEGFHTSPKIVFEDGDLHKGKLMDAMAQHGLPAPSFGAVTK